MFGCHEFGPASFDRFSLVLYYPWIVTSGFMGSFGGGNESVTAFRKETKPLALNAFSKTRVVLEIPFGKVNFANYPESPCPCLKAVKNSVFRWFRTLLIIRN